MMIIYQPVSYASGTSISCQDSHDIGGGSASVVIQQECMVYGIWYMVYGIWTIPQCLVGTIHKDGGF